MIALFKSVVNFLDGVCGWDKLLHIGNNKTVKSFTVWLIVVPIIAKLLENTEGVLNLILPFLDKPIQLQLPFKWYIFYLCSVFFSAANLVYLTFCPEIFKQYLNFSEFNKKDNSYELLKKYLVSHLQSKPDLNDAEIDTFIVRNCLVPTRDDFPNYRNWREKLDASQVADNKLPDIFYYIRECLHNIVPLARFSCLFFYFFGFSLLAYVLYENFVFVLNTVK